MKMAVRTRWQAAGLHATISVVVACLAGALVFGLWFPHPFQHVAGGTELFKLMTGIDVVLGPLLTLVIYKSQKKRHLLALDLTVIGLLQVGALAYGLHTVYLARPVYLVHEVDRVQMLVAADIDESELYDAEPAFRALPHWGVRLIGVREPRDGAELLQSVQWAMQGRDAAMRPSWWKDINEAHLAVMRKRSVSWARLRELVPAEVDQLLRASGLSEPDLMALPLICRDQVWTVVLRNDDAQVVGYLPIDPF